MRVAHMLPMRLRGPRQIVYAKGTRLVPHFREAIEADRAAPAALLAALAVSVGILNAGCLTY
jgi:uncharacterized membrane protein YjfL (UPF0719 family)